jgi:hypothetical protein
LADGERELLVLIDSGRSREALAALRAVADVPQTLPPRLALVVAPGGADDLAAIVGVVGVYADGAPPEDVMAALNDTEQLFVRAWVERSKDKDRPGDGLPWDDPDHLPPDPPPCSAP